MTKLEKDQNFVWHPFDVMASENNIFIKKATGVYLHTNDGRKILDAISSWWVNLHGHRNKYISAAVAKQLRYVEHVIFAGFTHEPAIRLAEGLVKVLPGQMKKIFFSDNGSTATEVALKIALQYWHNLGKPKTKIIAMEGAYHGDTFGAMSVGERSKFNVPFEQLFFEVHFLPFPTIENKAIVEKKLQEWAATQEFAAFIYEPLVQGSSGMKMYAPEILDNLLQIAQQEQIICIADEVMTGFGRTGKNFASEYCQNNPDIICLSKGLTGGYLPLGATAANAKIVAAFQSTEIEKIFLHGHSYTANPLSCAAAVESLRILQTTDCKAKIQQLTQSFEQWIPVLATEIKIQNIRHLGCILAFDVVLNEQTDTSYFSQLREKLYRAFISKNILLRPLGNVIYILPPYIITEKELNFILKTIMEIMDEL
jgi:adenosylmethionine---8-amino-7-oxononanoate aminotransferase